MNAPRLAWDAKATLGEGPLWSKRDRAVYWTDIKAPAINRFDIDTRLTKSWPMPEPVGWIIERRDRPGFIAGFRSGLAELTLDPLSIVFRARPESDRPQNRLNDAKADSAGRVWFGSMDDAEVERSGRFWRLDADFSVHAVDDGYRVANGPAFSPDGRILYHTDSADRVIYQYDIGADGSAGNKHVFVRIPEADGYPDGMTTDAEGCLWVGHWAGWRVSRFRPDGSLDRVIPMPVSRVTSCVFAGDALDRLFVTSARIGLSQADLAKEPLAGGLFEVNPGVAGLPVQTFAG